MPAWLLCCHSESLPNVYCHQKRKPETSKQSYLFCINIFPPLDHRGLLLWIEQGLSTGPPWIINGNVLYWSSMQQYEHHFIFCRGVFHIGVLAILYVNTVCYYILAIVHIALCYIVVVMVYNMFRHWVPLSVSIITGCNVCSNTLHSVRILVSRAFLHAALLPPQSSLQSLVARTASVLAIDDMLCRCAQQQETISIQSGQSSQLLPLAVAPASCLQAASTLKGYEGLLIVGNNLELTVPVSGGETQSAAG